MWRQNGSYCRIFSPAARDALALIAIDEAHCISQWGMISPEYAELGRLRHLFPHIPLVALTATADDTRQDILNRFAK